MNILPAPPAHRRAAMIQHACNPAMQQASFQCRKPYFGPMRARRGDSQWCQFRKWQPASSFQLPGNGSLISHQLPSESAPPHADVMLGTRRHHADDVSASSRHYVSNPLTSPLTSRGPRPGCRREPPPASPAAGAHEMALRGRARVWWQPLERLVEAVDPELVR